MSLSEQAIKLEPNEPFSYLYKGKSLQELTRYEEDIEYFDKALNNTIDQIKAKETDSKKTISIDEAKNIVKEIENDKVKYLIYKIEKIHVLTQKSLGNIKSIISDLESTKIEVHERSFETLVFNSIRMVVNSIKIELSSNIPTPKNLNEVIKFYVRE